MIKFLPVVLVPLQFEVKRLIFVSVWQAFDIITDTCSTQPHLYSYIFYCHWNEKVFQDDMPLLTITSNFYGLCCKLKFRFNSSENSFCGTKYVFVEVCLCRSMSLMKLVVHCVHFFLFLREKTTNNFTFLGLWLNQASYSFNLFLQKLIRQGKDFY